MIYASRVPIIIIDTDSVEFDLRLIRLKTNFLSVILRSPPMWVDTELQLADLQAINRVVTHVDQFFEFIQTQEFREQPEVIKYELKKNCVQTLSPRLNAVFNRTGLD